MSRRFKALFGALAASACLSACVGTDPQASLPSGGVALTAFSAPMPAAPQRLSAGMPGDPLFDTQKTERGGVNPIAVLDRSPTRAVASASGSTTRSAASNSATLAARLEESPKHLPQGMATLSAGPSPAAARTASADDDMKATMRAASATSTLTPLSEVEARAAAEQRAQTLRDKRFDSQVRHASSIVCSGCVSAPGRRRGSTQVDELEE